MQSLVSGFNGWLKPKPHRREALQLVDTTLTAIAATIIVLTFILVVH